MTNIQSLLKQIPKLPGVYIFKNKNKIIYIGKALNLFNRVRSYFQKQTDIKIKILSGKIDDIEYFVTNNEVEALLLENNLIKKHQPRYNVSLRDAKSYPMLKITNQNLPKIMKCREKVNAKDEYFGPYINIETIRNLQKVFKKVLKIRSCNKKFKPPYNYTPCLNYHIGECSAPCASLISEKEYLKVIDMARNILNGKINKILKILKNKMDDLSKDFEYESAAKVRDQIKIIESLTTFQYIDNQSKDNNDYIGVYSDFNEASITVLKERNGRVIEKETFIVSNIIDYTTVLSDFLNAYYLNISNFPNKIYVPNDINSSNVLIKAINEKFKINIDVKLPNNPKTKKLVILAKQNAEIFFEEKQYRLEMIHELRDLKKVLDLPKIPKIIEGFDVATLDGKFNTAAMVNFIDGKPNKVEYRQFNIEGQGHPDDYAMMEEVIARRYQKLKNEKLTFPDLILVDGGIGQVRSASKVLSILELNIPIIGLAKKEEHIYKKNSNKPVILPKGSPALKLVQRVRDEAHRFSNFKLKKRYTRKNLKSELAEIEGLGEKKVNILLKEFGSVRSLLETEKEEIAKIEGIGEALAKKIYHHLHL